MLASHIIAATVIKRSSQDRQSPPLSSPLDSGSSKEIEPEGTRHGWSECRHQAGLFDDPITQHVTFESVWLAGQYDGEEAQLAYVDEHLVAVLVRAEGEDQPPGSQAWFFEIGFGPCRAEGTLFPTLSAVEAWIRDRVPAGWPATPHGSPPARSALSR